MIHIENVTININKMPEILFSEQTQEGWDDVEADAPASPEHMNSLQQLQARLAHAWLAVCELLSEVSPDWNSGPGSTKENAIAAIRAMAKAR